MSLHHRPRCRHTSVNPQLLLSHLIDNNQTYTFSFTGHEVTHLLFDYTIDFWNF